MNIRIFTIWHTFSQKCQKFSLFTLTQSKLPIGYSLKASSKGFSSKFFGWSSQIAPKFTRYIGIFLVWRSFWARFTNTRTCKTSASNGRLDKENISRAKVVQWRHQQRLTKAIRQAAVATLHASCIKMFSVLVGSATTGGQLSLLWELQAFCWLDYPAISRLIYS